MKKTIKIIGCILFVTISIYLMISLFSSTNTASPKVYSSIQSFENETNITVYEFYNLESFLLTDKVEPLKDSSNDLFIWLQSNKKDEKNYKIEIEKEGFYHYEFNNSTFNDNTDNMRKDVLGDGILYQYHFTDESLYGRYFVGIYVRNNLYYRIGFTNNDLDISFVEQKLIKYIKLVENIN